MFAMTICANRRSGLASGQSLAVNSISVFALDVTMASAARPRNIEVINRGFNVVRGEDPVGRALNRVAIIAGDGPL